MRETRKLTFTKNKWKDSPFKSNKELSTKKSTIGKKSDQLKETLMKKEISFKFKSKTCNNKSLLINKSNSNKLQS